MQLRLYLMWPAAALLPTFTSCWGALTHTLSSYSTFCIIDMFHPGTIHDRVTHVLIRTKAHEQSAKGEHYGPFKSAVRSVPAHIIEAHLRCLTDRHPLPQPVQCDAGTQLWASEPAYRTGKIARSAEHWRRFGVDTGNIRNVNRWSKKKKRHAQKPNQHEYHQILLGT